MNTLLEQSAITELSGWRDGKRYRGTKTALIAAGLIKPEWFPGLPGNAKTSVRVGMVNGEMRVLRRYDKRTAEQREHGNISISIATKREFDVWMHFGKEELDRRKEERERRLLKQEIEKLHAEKKRKLELAPKFYKARFRTYCEPL